MHWPADDGTTVEDYWQAFLDLKREGRIRAAGLSNHGVCQLEAAEWMGHMDAVQPPFSLIHRGAADDVMLWAHEHGTGANTPDLLAEVLRRLAAAVRAYGGLIRADLAAGRVPEGGELERHLAEARQQQDRLAPVLRDAPSMGPAGWRLRGEILVHLDRLTNELQVEQLGRARENAGTPSWLRRMSPGLLGGRGEGGDDPGAEGAGDGQRGGAHSRPGPVRLQRR